jgi:hypothetical protein
MLAAALLVGVAGLWIASNMKLREAASEGPLVQPRSGGLSRSAGTPFLCQTENAGGLTDT